MEANASSTSDFKEQRMLAGHMHVDTEGTKTTGKIVSAHFHLYIHKHFWYQVITEIGLNWSRTSVHTASIWSDSRMKPETLMLAVSCSR